MRLMRRLVGTLRCAHATSTHSASSSLDGEESHAAPPRQGGPPKIYFPIPSVLDSMDLPGFARRHGAQLRSDIETEMLALSRTDGPFMKQCIQEELDAAFAPLLTLKRLEVEDYVKQGRHKLDVARNGTRACALYRNTPMSIQSVDRSFSRDMTYLGCVKYAVGTGFLTILSLSFTHSYSERMTEYSRRWTYSADGINSQQTAT